MGRLTVWGGLDQAEKNVESGVAPQAMFHKSGCRSGSPWGAPKN